MTADGLAQNWSRHFGLASAPLFEAGEISDPTQHAVLLNGGTGSFIVSHGYKSPDPRSFASWAWSAGLAHHVSVFDETVLVTRWDKPEAGDVFTLRSVSEKLDAFYTFLTQQRISGRPDVIATLLDLFRAVRGEVEASGASDNATVAEFLDILAQLVASDQP
jgi:hypothetical protein